MHRGSLLVVHRAFMTRLSLLFGRHDLRTYPNDLLLVGDLGIRAVGVLMHLLQLVSSDGYLLVLVWDLEDRMQHIL